MAITVPEPKTDVRLSQVADRPSYETEKPDQRIETALGAGGAIGIQWRPKVAEAEVDQSLTAASDAVVDVQEDGVRVAWTLALAFRRGQREVFSIDVPKDYLVEKVEGPNVRGWEVQQGEKAQNVKITLLKPAKDGERFTLRLWRRGAVAEFDVPVVTVAGAALQNGRVTLRRSPLVDLQTVTTSGVARTDLAAATKDKAKPREPEAIESPLGIRPFQAYQFVTTPFSIRLAASPVAAKTTAQLQTVLKIAEHERNLESRVRLAVEDRPIYRAEILLPEGFNPDEVSAPGVFHWAITAPAAGAKDPRRLLTVYFGGGQQGEVAILLRGKLARAKADEPLVSAAAGGRRRAESGRRRRRPGRSGHPRRGVRSEGLRNGALGPAARLAATRAARADAAGAAPSRGGLLGPAELLAPRGRRRVYDDHQRPRHRSRGRGNAACWTSRSARPGFAGCRCWCQAGCPAAG